MLLPPQSLANFQDLVARLKQGSVTAFVGAGLSASQLPTWEHLHAKLQEASGLVPKRLFDPDFAPVDFADFRDAMMPEAYLQVLRDTFAGVVTHYPDHYRLLDETGGFDKLVTTNYDEFVATVAVSNNRSPRIAIYPDLTDLSARYVYLHGRAYTADTPADLVVCEDDYGRAYGDMGHAKNMLRVLFSRPGVFFGSSLKDPDLLALIRERARYLQLTHLDAEPPLFAVIAAKPDAEGDDAFIAAAEVTTGRLERLGVRAICYRHDQHHSQLRATMLQLRHDAEPRAIEALSLDRSKLLNRLGAKASPSANDVKQVLHLIRGVPELARHFFLESATTTAWYDKLKDSVIIPSAIEPWLFGEEGLRYISWSPAPYVERIAPQYPAAVIELMHRLSVSNNPDVQSTLVRAATRLPLRDFEDVLPIIGQWMASPYRRASRVDIPLALFAGELSKAQAGYAASLAILDQLLTPVNTEVGDLELNVVDYWLSYLKEPRDRLTARYSSPTYLVLKRHLITALGIVGFELDAYSEAWRPAIADDERNHPVRHWILSYLLDGVRDAILAWSALDPVAAAAEIDELLHSEHALLQRIGLHVASERPKTIPLLSQPILHVPFVLNDEFFHEVALLLNQRFADLDARSQALVHRYIQLGSPSHPLASEEQRQRYLDYDRWRWLAVLPQDARTVEEQGWWSDLLRTRGLPSQPFYWVQVENVERNVESPEPPPWEQCKAAWFDDGAPALISALRSNREGRWSLQSLVDEDPAGLLALAPFLDARDSDLIETYVGAYSTALTTKNETPFDWEPLVELMERVTRAEIATVRSATGYMGRFIREGLLSEQQPIPSEHLAPVASILARIIGAFATELSAPPISDSWMGRIHQLNHDAGIAADTFMLTIWRMLRVKNPEERHLPDEISAWIDMALDVGWGGQEMRHALGQYGSILGWGEPGWLFNHLEAVWPCGDSREAVNARRLFLHGLLHATHWSLTEIEVLLPVLSEAVRDLGREEPLYFSEAGQRGPFVTYLVLGWLNDCQGFGFDGLIGKFTKVAPDTVRAMFVRELGRHFRMSRGQEQLDYDGTLAKRDKYWSWRIDELGHVLPVSEPSEELSTFCSWQEYPQRSLRSLEPRFVVSIDHLTDGFHAMHLLEYIAARGESEPLPALRLLHRLADHLLTTHKLALWTENRELEAALDAACRGSRPTHRRQVRQLTDVLVRGGLTSYARQLEQCGK
jgi:hypothetical protein